MRRTLEVISTGLIAATVFAAPALAASPSVAAPGGAVPAGAGQGTVGRAAVAHVWLAGTVTAVGPSSLTLTVSRTGPHDTQLNGQTLVVATAASTAVTRGKDATSITLGDVKVGDLVGISAAGDAASALTATRIAVREICHMASGTVTGVNGATVTFAVDRAGKDVPQLVGQTLSVQVAPDAVIVQGKDKSPAQLSAVQTGARVTVALMAEGNDLTKALTADKVHIAGPANHWVGGTVTGVAGTTVVVSVARTGQHDSALNGQALSLQIAQTAELTRGKDGSAITPTDVVVGDRVGVIFQASSTDPTQGAVASRLRDWGQGASRQGASQRKATAAGSGAAGGKAPSAPTATGTPARA